MAFWRRRAEDPEIAAERAAVRRVTREMNLARGDRVLAGAHDVITGCVVAATVAELVMLTKAGEEVWRKRWLEVDAGSWENTTGTVSVTWVDGSRGTQWTFGRDEMHFPEVFRDRVEASRVIDAPVVDRLNGNASVGRAAIRKDLRTGELVPQVMYDRRVRRDDTHSRHVAEAVLADLAEQVGL